MTADARTFRPARVRIPRIETRSVAARCTALCAAALLCAAPALAQSSANAPRKKNYAPRPTLSHDWNGLVVDFAVTRPLNSRLVINNGPTRVAESNLTGIQLSGTAAYLFQKGHFIVGPRITATGSWIESMPFDYTVRHNAAFTFGGEAGFANGRWYFYGFGGGGFALVSAERVGLGQARSMVPAYEVGGGLRYALARQWFAKTEFSYTVLGDHRLGNETFDPKPYNAFTVGFGVQFGSK